MTIPVWEPGTLYQPGAIVQPLTAGQVTQSPPTNASIESGATGWTFSSASIAAQQDGFVFNGSWSIRWNGTFYAAGYGTGFFTNNNKVAVRPGQKISANCRHRRGTDNFDRQGAKLGIQWLDASQVALSTDYGVQINGGKDGPWFELTVSATAPAGAAFAQIRVDAFNRNDGSDHPLWFDAFSWDYTFQGIPDGLMFRAVQANAGRSGNTEPQWPTVSGQQVVDNEVTWEALFVSRVVWEAEAILVSGEYEPQWPTAPGGTVRDGSIAWKCMDHRIKDEKCPQSKVVTIGASKVFAADGDIVAFCATVNPLDWTTPEDAGFLPFGLQAHGGSGCEALGLYNSNLVAFSERGYQIWQIDEDPANMALLDAKPVDCRYHLSLQPISNDLLFLSSQGIRNIGTAGATGNMQAGWFGKQIDPLVLAALRDLERANAASNLVEHLPLGLYWPGAGQYWLFFGEEAFVLTMNGGTKDMSWSHYVFPSAVEAWTILDGDLYLRTGDIVWHVSDEALTDDEAFNTEIGSTNVKFEGRVWWNYLDFGVLGTDKTLNSVDLACTGRVDISIGYNQRNTALATTPHSVDGDTLPEDPLPIEVTGPSLQLRLNFGGGQAWEWSAAALNIS